MNAAITQKNTMAFKLRRPVRSKSHPNVDHVHMLVLYNIVKDFSRVSHSPTLKTLELWNSAASLKVIIHISFTAATATNWLKDQTHFSKPPRYLALQAPRYNTEEGGAVSVWHFADTLFNEV